MNIFFVILHYQALNETCNCVESILNNYENAQIIIVDNASPNKSGIEIKEKFINNNRVVVLLSERNLGFACGNNIGYRYAKEKGANFIVQVNNDTVFEDKEFVKKIEQLYKKEHFAVLGPDVICTKDGGHQNPLKSMKMTSFSILSRIVKNYLGLFLLQLNLDLKFKQHSDYQSAWKEKIDISNSTEYVLQGCCYIFSIDYIEKIDGMFEGTYMYYEEYIMDYICRKNQLKMIYSPDLGLKHLRQVATNSTVENSKEKRKFKYKQSIKSLSAFYRYMKNID